MRLKFGISFDSNTIGESHGLEMTFCIELPASNTVYVKYITSERHTTSICLLYHALAHHYDYTHMDCKGRGKNEVIGLPSCKRHQVQELSSNHDALPPIALANPT